LNRCATVHEAIRHFEEQPGDRLSLAGNHVFGLEEDQTGQLWVGTYGGGVCAFNRKTGVFERLARMYPSTNTLEISHVKVVREDSRGRLWIGHLFGRLYVLNRGTGGVKEYSLAQDSSQRHLDDVLCLLETRDATIWVGTALGLFTVDEATGQVEAVPLGEQRTNPTAHVLVYALAEDGKGDVWVGTRSCGLICLSTAGDPIAVFRVGWITRPTHNSIQ